MRNRGGWRAAALLLALAGCAGRVWTDQASADGVSLHWYTREATIDIAHAAAVEHCRRYGKGAVLLDEFEDQDITRSHFACR